jgi:hypothetical protein
VRSRYQPSSRYSCKNAPEYSITSWAVFTFTRNCATSVLMPPLPPTYSSQPESTPITPTSLIPASAQLRGQPETASFTLCGEYIAHSARSRSLPICVLSWVPNRHHSLPTQVFTVRRLLA